VRHLLLTNDFPPKVGGIQSYLWELWRRLPPEDVTVLTTPHPGARRWDAEQKFRVVRVREPVLLPSPLVTKRANALAAEVGAQAIIIDPALPLGLVGPSLDLPYGVVLHGAEVTVPARLPASRNLLRRVLGHASLVIAAGGYPEAEGRRAVGPDKPFPPVALIPPGVDIEQFQPLPTIERYAARARLGLPATGPLVVSVSRLVPRKGMDTLIDAAALLRRDMPGLHVVIAGGGRDRKRLEWRISRRGAPVRLLGKVPDADLAALYATADVFALCCRTRWAGLEQEGFGIVFVEAAAAGVPVVAGRSGGSAEAVLNGETGIVLDDPDDPAQAAQALRSLLIDADKARRMGQAGRARVEREFSYDQLSERLRQAIDGMISAPSP
jgi:phosphatidylinositol alpha-1,6-mannosyltransferase